MMMINLEAVKEGEEERQKQKTENRKIPTCKYLHHLDYRGETTLMMMIKLEAVKEGDEER